MALNRIVGLCVLFALSHFVTAQVYAYDYKVCLRVLTDLQDDRIGEDFGKGVLYNGEYYWRMRGARFKLYDARNDRRLDGYLDKNGCTKKFSTPYHYGIQIEFWSYGKLLAGNRLYVRSGSSENVGYYYKGNITLNRQSGTYDVFHTSNVVLPRLYAVYAYMINNRFRGKYDYETLTVWHGKGYCNPATSTASSACIEGKNDYHNQIGTGSNRRKFVMAHEYGHINLAATGAGGGNDCSLGGSAHSMTSLEYQSCAAMEGWAHFVAAAAWNSRSGSAPTGVFRYWNSGNTIFSIESADANYDSNYCGTGTQCDGGYGYEIDWLRHLWDFWSNGGDNSYHFPGHKPTSTEMQNIFNTPWNKFNIYDQVLSKIESIYNCSFITSGTMCRRWWNSSVINGVNYW